jgi:hypothetical protein
MSETTDILAMKYAGLIYLKCAKEAGKSVTVTSL